MADESSPLISDEPIPDTHLSLMERFAAWIILSSLILFIGAVVGNDIVPGNTLSETVQTNFLDPLNQDSTQGDAGYNPVDTAAYSVLLVSFVVVISAWLRKIGFPARDQSLIALLPWVFWAALGEVNEDGALFRDGIGALFVSPLVHFHVALWVVITAFMSHRVYLSEGVEGRQSVTQLSVILVLLQVVCFWPQFLYHWDVSLSSPLLWLPLSGIILIIALHPILVDLLTPIEQGLMQVGIGGCFLHLSAWLSMYFYPLQNNQPESFWPMAVVMLLPLVICLICWSIGRHSRIALHHMGLEPGIIPLGITIDDWENQRSSTFERMESLSPMAMLSVPVVLLAMYGQMVDGLATYLGVDHFGYSEKHVLSQKVIELSGAAWGFAALKFVLAGVVWFLFASARFEQRHRHLRLLVILCLLTVGLAPGLRDILRLTLGI